MSVLSTNITTASKPSSSLRVRVINSDSGLSKDLLVEIRTGWTLFDAIYNTEAVKKANVRKWNPTVTQNVKKGSHEIRCSVDVIIQDNNDDAIIDDKSCKDSSAPLHSYSINEMKQTSTKQLYNLVGGPEHGDAVVTMRLLHTNKKSKAAFDHSRLLPQHHPSIPSGENNGGGKILRCPFSGVAFDESALKHFVQQNQN